jgi:hypothetical protein
VAARHPAQLNHAAYAGDRDEDRDWQYRPDRGEQRRYRERHVSVEALERYFHSLFVSAG